MSITTTIEIKDTLHVCITSGIKGPEIELTDEETSKIISLVNELDAPWTGSSFFGMGLSPDHFLVHITTPTLMVYLDTNMTGYVKLYKAGPDAEYNMAFEQKYKDTVGLWGYLAPIAHRAYQQWIAEQERYSKEYAEKAAAGVPGYIDFSKVTE